MKKKTKRRNSKREIYLGKYIKEKRDFIVVFGVLFAVLTFTLTQIQQINEDYAAIMVLFISLLIILIGIELLNDSEYFSMETWIFVSTLGMVAVLTFLTFSDRFKGQLTYLINFTLIVLSLGLGIGLGAKIVRVFKKHQKKFLFNMISLIIGTSLVFNLKESLDFLNKVTIGLGFKETLLPLINGFWIGFLGFFILFGLFKSGKEVVIISKIYIKKFEHSKFYKRLLTQKVTKRK